MTDSPQGPSPFSASRARPQLERRLASLRTLEWVNGLLRLLVAASGAVLVSWLTGA